MTVAVEPLTARVFAPYGGLLAGGAEAASYVRPGLDVWAQPFLASAPPRLQVMRYHHQPMDFALLERHVGVTEARVPLAGAAAVLVVGGLTDIVDAGDVPEPTSLRAFLLDGTCGVIFRPGLWHALDCFPVSSPHADFLLISDEATEREIEGQKSPVSGRWTHVADYAAQGVSFEVSDPRGLLMFPG